MAKKGTTTKVKKVEAKAKTLNELREDLLIAQKSLHDGTLQNPHTIKSLRKDIARALTKENASKEADKKGEK